MINIKAILQMKTGTYSMLKPEKAKETPLLDVAGEIKRERGKGFDITFYRDNKPYALTKYNEKGYIVERKLIATLDKG